MTITLPLSEATVRAFLLSSRDNNQLQPARHTPRPSWAKRLQAKRQQGRQVSHVRAITVS